MLFGGFFNLAYFGVTNDKNAKYSSENFVFYRNYDMHVGYTHIDPNMYDSY